MFITVAICYALSPLSSGLSNGCCLCITEIFDCLPGRPSNLHIMHVPVPGCLHDTLWLIVYRLLNVKWVFDPNLLSEKWGITLQSWTRLNTYCVSAFSWKLKICVWVQMSYIYSAYSLPEVHNTLVEVLTVATLRPSPKTGRLLA
jgi:hypothetical protein